MRWPEDRGGNPHPGPLPKGEGDFPQATAHNTPCPLWSVLMTDTMPRRTTVVGEGRTRPLSSVLMTYAVPRRATAVGKKILSLGERIQVRGHGVAATQPSWPVCHRHNREGRGL